MPNFIKVEQKERVGIITLSRPKQLNALNAELMQGLAKALYDYDADEGIGAIVITGGEKAFAAGADIGAMKDFSYMDAFKSDYITRDWEHILRIRKPVIAAVAGYALGGGKELALMCDIVIAEDAERAGLVSRVVPLDKLMEEALAVAQKIAACSLPVVMMIKESINRAYETSLSEGVRFERRLFHSQFALEDQKEGMAAFLEKRKPAFKNR